MTRRGATGLRAVVAVDKPSGMTSHDVVARVRRATGEGRVGHAGTLDPAATGVMVVLVGPYTRLEPYLSGARKSYVATIAFGCETDTDDAEGEVTCVVEVPDALFEPDAAQAALDGLLGASSQTPPAYSAIKVGGRVAHRAARSGEALELAARPVEVYDAHLLAVDPAARTWTARFTVSKGTYVRALARDLGRAVGSAAHLAALRRTASGLVSLDDARPLDEVCESAEAGLLAEVSIDPFAALGLPVIVATAAEVANGRRLPASAGAGLPAGARVAVSVDAALAGVYAVTDDGLVPDLVMPAAS